MTCENYFLDADAMNLIGPKMGIQTFSYQYSNMSEIGPIMMSTADTLFTFSELFHKRFSNNSIKPNSFYDIGYPYDSSFSLVKNELKSCASNWLIMAHNLLLVILMKVFKMIKISMVW